MKPSELRDYQAIAALAEARSLTDVEAERTAIDDRIAEIMRRTEMLPTVAPPGPEEPPGPEVPPGTTSVDVTADGLSFGPDGRVTSGIAHC